MAKNGNLRGVGDGGDERHWGGSGEVERRKKSPSIKLGLGVLGVE